MSYKNHKDQKLIFEAYVKVVEKAPQGFFNRLRKSVGSSIINKAASIPILGHAFAGAKERIESSAEAQQQVNKAKAQFETLYRQKLRKKYSSRLGAGRQFVIDFIKNVLRADVNDSALSSYLTGATITDKNINEAITVAFAVRDMGGGGSSRDKAALQNIITTYQTSGTLNTPQQNKLKALIGDWTKPPGNTISYKLEDTDGNQKSLTEIMALLNNPAKKLNGIKFLQKALDDMD